MPGAVVLGSDFKALGVVRSLGRRDIPSIVIDNQPRSAWFSRYLTKRFLWKGPMDNEDFVRFLLNFGKQHRLERWLLYPLQDEAVELVARNSRQLAAIYRLVTQDWDIVQQVCGKRLTYQVAHDTGIPYPKTWYPKCENELNAMEITFPAIIKPAISIRFQYATRLKALPVNSHEELLQ